MTLVIRVQSKFPSSDDPNSSWRIMWHSRVFILKWHKKSSFFPLFTWSPHNTIPSVLLSILTSRQQTVVLIIWRKFSQFLTPNSFINTNHFHFSKELLTMILIGSTKCIQSKQLFWNAACCNQSSSSIDIVRPVYFSSAVYCCHRDEGNKKEEVAIFKQLRRFRQKY